VLAGQAGHAAIGPVAVGVDALVRGVDVDVQHARGVQVLAQQAGGGGRDLVRIGQRAQRFGQVQAEGLLGIGPDPCRGVLDHAQ
jgi:hypothetical protein